jgi:hypothetical protein
MLKKIVLLFEILITFTCVNASTIYISPTGSDHNIGDKASPLLTITKAQENTLPGDTVYIRGGSYTMSVNQISSYSGVYAHVIDINKSGLSQKYINYWNYPGEKPVFDFTNIKSDNFRVSAFWVSASWVRFKGFDVVGVQVTIKTHTQSESFSNDGSHNIYEMLNMHDGQAIGLSTQNEYNPIKSITKKTLHHYDYKNS